MDERVLERTPADRWGVPHDLAGIGVFLCGHASDFVTGLAIAIDGGYTINGRISGRRRFAVVPVLFGALIDAGTAAT
jgi:hypothetical protein